MFAMDCQLLKYLLHSGILIARKKFGFSIVTGIIYGATDERK